MKFSNGRKLTVMSLVFMAIALGVAIFGDSEIVACTALIISSLEDSHEV